VGLFGATKPRIIRRASDCARHRRFRDGNCVVPEPNSTTCVQNCYCKKLSKTRAITVTQVRFESFDVHSSRSTGTSGLFPQLFIPLYTSHHRNITNCPAKAELHFSYRMHYCAIRYGRATLGRCAIVALRRDHRAYSVVPPHQLAMETRTQTSFSPALSPAPTPRIYRDKRWNSEVLSLRIYFPDMPR
jgi:hypothetical protein